MILNEVSPEEAPRIIFPESKQQYEGKISPLWESYKWLLPTTTISQSIAMQCEVQEMVDTSCAQ